MASSNCERTFAPSGYLSAPVSSAAAVVPDGLFPPLKCLVGTVGQPNAGGSSIPEELSEFQLLRCVPSFDEFHRLRRRYEAYLLDEAVRDVSTKAASGTESRANQQQRKEALQYLMFGSSLNHSGAMGEGGETQQQQQEHLRRRQAEDVRNKRVCKVPSYVLLAMRGKEPIDPRRDGGVAKLDMSTRPLFLLGRDNRVCDVVLAHGSTSSQHAIVGFRKVFAATPNDDAPHQAVEENETGDHDHHVPSSGLPLDWAIDNSSPSSSLAVNTKRKKEASTTVGYCMLTKLELFVMDLGSANGTFVKGSGEDEEDRLDPFEPWPLMEGDAIRMGSSSRVFVVVEGTS